MSSTTSAGPKRVVNKTVTKILANQKSVAQEKTPAAAGKLRKKPQPQPKAPAPAPALAQKLLEAETTQSASTSNTSNTPDNPLEQMETEDTNYDSLPTTTAERLLHLRKLLKKTLCNRARARSHSNFLNACTTEGSTPLGLQIKNQCQAMMAELTNVKKDFDLSKKRTQEEWILTLKKHYAEVSAHLSERETSIMKEMEDTITMTEDEEILEQHRVLVTATVNNAIVKEKKMTEKKTSKLEALQRPKEKRRRTEEPSRAPQREHNTGGGGGRGRGRGKRFNRRGNKENRGVVHDNYISLPAPPTTPPPSPPTPAHHQQREAPPTTRRPPPPSQDAIGAEIQRQLQLALRGTQGQHQYTNYGYQAPPPPPPPSHYTHPPWTPAQQPPPLFPAGGEVAGRHPPQVPSHDSQGFH